MMPETLTKLQSIILSNPYDIKKGPNLFYNDKGPSQGGAGGGEIYIDCQPVGSSDELRELVTDMGSSSYPTNISELLSNPIVKLLFGSLLFILILFGVKYALNAFKMPKGGSTIQEVLHTSVKGGGWRK